MFTYTKFVALVLVASTLALVAVAYKVSNEEMYHTYTAYYYSGAKNKELQVKCYGSSNDQVSSLAEGNQRMWTSMGYKRFYRQGRLGISILSGKPRSVCVVDSSTPPSCLGTKF